MIVYNENKKSFVQDVKDNIIADKILSLIREKGFSAGQEREFESWHNSMQFMRNIVDDQDIDDDVQVATGRRTTFVRSGQFERARS